MFPHLRSTWLTIAHHLAEGCSRAWALEEPQEEHDPERNQVAPQPPKPHPTGVAAGREAWAHVEHGSTASHEGLQRWMPEL